MAASFVHACEADLAEQADGLSKAFRSMLTSGTEFPALVQRLGSFYTQVERQLAAQSLDQDRLTLIREVLTRIWIVSSGLAALDEFCHTSAAELVPEVRETLRFGITATASSTSCRSDVDDGFTPLRHWFLDHFDWPYPDENAYTFLGGQLPSMTRHQIATWFINARRRSGWTDFRREFAEEDYHNFQRLLAAIDEPGSKAAKKKYDKVRLYFEPDRKDVVSETILEVIKQKTPKDLPSKHAPARAVQRVTKRAARGVGARHDEEDELAPAVQGSWSPRRRHELPAASSPLPAPSFDPIVDFHRNTTPSPGSGSDLGLPRLPSAFVSPATSARSFSGSSSSSLDSLVSYGSSDYAPQNVRMEHTTPSAGAPAISVAPQQPQLTSTSSSQTLALPALEFPHVLRPGPSTFSSPAHPHPYFCTLNELPPVPNFRGPFANSISG